MSVLFDKLYYPTERQRQAFGPEYDPPCKFRAAEWEDVARLEKDPPDGDGHVAVVQEMRMPARFFALEVLPTELSDGTKSAGWRISTGSGEEMGRLMLEIGKAVAQGMVGLDKVDGKSVREGG